MEICSEADSVEKRREHWKLLSNLKTTVEGLLSTNNPNVWSRYGGLQRLHKDMTNILSHGLKHEQVYYKQKDYWRFVWCLRSISPSLAPHVEQFSQMEPVLSSSVQCESDKAERWLLHSLQSHTLSIQLKPLITHHNTTRKYYTDEAFLLSELHVAAMFQCLEAVEQNDARLLALINTTRLSYLKECVPVDLLTSPQCVLPGVSIRTHAPSCSFRDNTHTSYTERSTDAAVCVSASGAPWACLSTDQSILEPLITQNSQTDSTHPVNPAPSEGGDCDGDDGPEYLAIGNLGRRSRRGSGSSAQSTEHSQIRAHIPEAPPPSQRRSSFSDMERGKRRSFRGHARSLSDTGVMQKHKQESAVDEQCVSSFGPFSPHSSDSSHSSLYMEAGGLQYGSGSDGLFRKPSEGQSLISYLSEQDFGSCADLEKENAHFSISESLIAAIELMKCKMRAEEADEDGDSDSEIQQLKQKIRLRRQQIRRNRLQTPSSTHQTLPSTDSGGSLRSSRDSLLHSDSGSADDVEDPVLRDADVKQNVNLSSRSFISSDSVSQWLLQSNSAESVAMGLLRQFEGLQLPAASELEWLVPEHDAPQKLLPMPDSVPISPDDGEHADVYKLRIRVRGNLEWAPPRPQIIFNIHHAPKRKVLVMKQNYRCAGCGTRIDPDYIKRLRYCEYLGRYFCQCCHENAVAVVPGRVLCKWDFSKYYVSNFARDLLRKIAQDPLFNLNDINSGLYKKVKNLEAVRVLRLQLFHMKNLFKTCRLAKEVLQHFDSVPAHLTEDLHLFSLNDLTAVRAGDLAPKLRDLVRVGSEHVASCVLCQAKGFVCEFCGNDKDIIFPFELNKCRRCEECSACYHRSCFKNKSVCPRCRRLAERRERMNSTNTEEEEGQ
ncbi:run domain Beclin-1-interacting and cysteine-rich domain-containing protein isoform X2 [Pangasianodon hypophthalmus]|uniref:run domain Beclin-1-interacting and cysteine-rich domain-containing protein isoform X2 n=1 Tax=Pangasianodon hypophthalmus TaxID=310915 RepID=UPI000F006868|nr:run domain Beclin-1-interacting and cysteine-rich domain-containing protein isoform X2 [Pangasianodon hypophthalmus]